MEGAVLFGRDVKLGKVVVVIAHGNGSFPAMLSTHTNFPNIIDNVTHSQPRLFTVSQPVCR